MPDIAMCSSNSCPKRNECLRYRAKPDPVSQWWRPFNQQNSSFCFYKIIKSDFVRDVLNPADWQLNSFLTK
jgi:hypothetical protein